MRQNPVRRSTQSQKYTCSNRSPDSVSSYWSPFPSPEEQWVFARSSTLRLLG